MPEPTSPFDDPFAELFDQLPNPRARQGRATSEDPVAPGATGRASSVQDAMPFVSAAAPQSRREARVAATVMATREGSARAAAAAESARSTQDLFLDADTDGHDGPPPRNEKRRRRIGGWIVFGIVLVLLGGAAAGGLWVWNTYEEPIRELLGWEEPKDYETGLAHGEALVTIAEGDTGGPISQSLFDAGVTKTPDAFYDYLIEAGEDPPFVPGVFKLQLEMTSAEALDALMDPANRMESAVGIPEGFTLEGTLERIAEGTGIPFEELEAAAKNPAAFGVAADSLEGWLFPATYTFNPGVTANEVIQTLVSRTVQSLDTANVPVAERQRILTIASIIQREARFVEDFYKVSRVIQNRLDPSNTETHGLLQMDSTAQYGFGEMGDGSASTSKGAQYDDNPWNTYVHPGLPVGPIANPGDVAIDAAMHPADGPWLYFVTVNMDTGETVFTNTYAEHLKANEQSIAWCEDHPDSGC